MPAAQKVPMAVSSETFSFLPRIPIPSAAARLNGITPEKRVHSQIVT